MIDRAIAVLSEELDLTAVELADLIWLTSIRQQGQTVPVRESRTRTPIIRIRGFPGTGTATPTPPSPPAPERPPASEPVAGIAPRRSPSDSTDKLGRQPIKVPNPPSIRNALALVRSLRPLMDLVPSGLVEGLDEQATAQQIAEARVWQPIVKPAMEPRFDLVLVADGSESMAIWRQTVLELRKLLRNYGTFRDVQLWELCWELHQGAGRFSVRSGLRSSRKRQQTSRHPQAIADPSGRRLIILASDCVADYWREAGLVEVLRLWSRSGPLAIAQVFPEWLWTRTAIRGYDAVELTAAEPALPNHRLTARWSDSWSGGWSGGWRSTVKQDSGVFVPIVPLEADALLAWSQMVMGHREASGYRVASRRDVVPAAPDEWNENPDESAVSPKIPQEIPQEIQQKIDDFHVVSSPVAQRLMGLVAASPSITLPVIRLIQAAMLPHSRQTNVAEVLLGGLLQPVGTAAEPWEREYEFVDEGIRDRLLAEMPVPDTVDVLSRYIDKQFGKSLDDFVAELVAWGQSQDRELVEKARPFATVTAAVLKRSSSHKLRDYARQIEQGYAPPPEPPGPVVFPPLQAIDFETVYVELEPESPLQLFTFDVATVSSQFTDGVTMAVIVKEESQAWQYVETLGNDVTLEMVAIPEGKFVMGSPTDEQDRLDWEGQQREVTLPAFFMGKYPVTQAQYAAVMGENPSRFQEDGAHRPVEQVSWHDAQAFCRKLSELTGKAYRLPSEAEWEYACRAVPVPPIALLKSGTAKIYPPFHFGETLAPELANYDWQYAYGKGPKLAKGSEGTTPVGQFGCANAFGLFDMHGNVWEWCEDDWHGNYTGAPVDGSAWVNEPRAKNGARVRRGGSWLNYPWFCRSAYRYSLNAGNRDDFLGFRISCIAPRR